MRTRVLYSRRRIAISSTRYGSSSGQPVWNVQHAVVAILCEDLAAHAVGVVCSRKLFDLRAHLVRDRPRVRELEEQLLHLTVVEPAARARMSVLTRRVTCEVTLGLPSRSPPIQVEMRMIVASYGSGCSPSLASARSTRR